MENKKLKILAAGDIHGDTHLAEKLAEKAVKENVDLVVLCGDITFFEQKTENLMGPFVKKNLKVLLIPGNHESFATADFFAEVYPVKNIHGYALRYNDVGIVGCGGANIGVASKLSEDEIFETLKTGFEKIKDLRKKIMVTHVHPSGTTMEKMSAFVPASTGIRKAIDKFQPDILLCSHVHEAEGLEEKIGKTKVINVGKEGKIIEI